MDEVAEDGWACVRDLSEVPAQVRADSVYWCDHVLLPEVNPHDLPDVEHAMHYGDGRSPDLIRHMYTAKGLDLDVVEGRNFLCVRVSRRSLDVLALPDGERPAAVSRAAAAIFREPLTFCHCDSVADGSIFCTDACADPRVLTSWTERAEGGIRGGELWFICYKRIAQLVGFSNPAQWFSDTCPCVNACSRRCGGRRSRSRP
ncbi:MAG: hypothetical protein QM820_13080 [Minicystis sp.]